MDAGADAQIAANRKRIADLRVQLNRIRP